MAAKVIYMSLSNWAGSISHLSQLMTMLWHLFLVPCINAANYWIEPWSTSGMLRSSVRPRFLLFKLRRLPYSFAHTYPHTQQWCTSHYLSLKLLFIAADPFLRVALQRQMNGKTLQVQSATFKSRVCVCVLLGTMYPGAAAFYSLTCNILVLCRHFSNFIFS